jgi:hypothetical protein
MPRVKISQATLAKIQEFATADLRSSYDYASSTILLSEDTLARLGKHAFKGESVDDTILRVLAKTGGLQ